MDNKILIEQSQHWEKNFSSKPEMFGSEPSHSAKIALENFKKNNVKQIVELGAGLGRDTIFFAKNSIKVTALDYSPTAVEIIKKKSDSLGLSDFIDAQTHDLRQKLNFKDDSFEGCYSHMLYCMALTNETLEKLNSEILRILKPGEKVIIVPKVSNDEAKEIYPDGWETIKPYLRKVPDPVK